MGKKLSWVDKKFGKICPKCSKRHGVFATIGTNVASGSKGKCDGI